MPTRPKLAAAEAGQVQHKTWDAFVSESLSKITPYMQILPPTADDPDPEPAEVPCPSGAQMVLLNAARSTGNDEAGFEAMFGEEMGQRLFLATQTLPFVVRAKILSDVMMHYGAQAMPGMPGQPDPE